MNRCSFGKSKTRKNKARKTRKNKARKTRKNKARKTRIKKRNRNSKKRFSFGYKYLRNDQIIRKVNDNAINNLGCA